MPARILIVDDEPVNTTYLYRVVTNEGFSADKTNSSVEALKFLEQHTYDVILLDLLMPQLSGNDLLEILQQKKTFDSTAVIVISGVVDPDSQRTAFELGACEYIKKPIEPLEVITRIKAVLRTKQTEKNLKDTVADLMLKNSIIENNIKTSQQAQRLILPSDEDFNSHFQDYFIYYEPRKFVSGDFYNIVRFGNNTFVYLADCSGQEVFAGYITLVVHKMIEQCLFSCHRMSLSRIFGELHKSFSLLLGKNEKIRENVNLSMIKFNPIIDLLEVCSANQCVALKHKGGGFVSFENEIPISNDFDNLLPDYRQASHRLSTVESVFMYTKGINKQYNSVKNLILSDVEFIEFIEENYKFLFQKGEMLTSNFLDKWRRHEPQTDDVTLIGLKLIQNQEFSSLSCSNL